MIEEMNSVCGALLNLWCAQNFISTCAVMGYARGLPQPEIPGAEPNVAIILPIKGDANLARLLPLLKAQNYSRYRIIATVESEQDPAFRMLAAAASQPGASIEVTVAGLAQSAGQKVWNQLAALDRLTPEDEIVAFIDADTLPTPLWLPRLVSAAIAGGRPVVTGYRWMVPSDDRLSSSCLAAANTSIATLPRALPRVGLPRYLCSAGAPLSRTIDWAGVRYRVNGPQIVTLERRDTLR
jgi:hypothetical protein